MARERMLTLLIIEATMIKIMAIINKMATTTTTTTTTIIIKATKISIMMINTMTKVKVNNVGTIRTMGKPIISAFCYNGLEVNEQ
jgi:ACR3 family arsenite efflux pump ArsB